MTLNQEPPIAVSIARFRKVYANAGIAVSRWQPHGVMGFVVRLKYHNDYVGTVIVSQAEIEGSEWIHASLSFPRHDPSYDDLALLKRATFGPKRVAYQVLTTDDQHVNFHQHALHLWGLASGEHVLPQFGLDGMI